VTSLVRWAVQSLSISKAELGKLLRLGPRDDDDDEERIRGSHCVEIISTQENNPAEVNNVDLAKPNLSTVMINSAGRGATQWPANEFHLSVPNTRVYNFYGRAFVRSKSTGRTIVDIVKVLINGGSVINLMPENHTSICTSLTFLKTGK
jgi:hypothetical protein